MPYQKTVTDRQKRANGCIVETGRGGGAAMPLLSLTQEEKKREPLGPKNVRFRATDYLKPDPNSWKNKNAVTGFRREKGRLLFFREAVSQRNHNNIPVGENPDGFPFEAGVDTGLLLGGGLVPNKHFLSEWAGARLPTQLPMGGRGGRMTTSPPHGKKETAPQALRGGEAYPSALVLGTLGVFATRGGKPGGEKPWLLKLLRLWKSGADPAPRKKRRSGFVKKVLRQGLVINAIERKGAVGLLGKKKPVHQRCGAVRCQTSWVFYATGARKKKEMGFIVVKIEKQVGVAAPCTS